MNITSKNYAGDECILVRKINGEPIPMGTMCQSFRGEPLRVMGGRAPQSPASQGKVWVHDSRTSAEQEYYPSVIDARWKVTSGHEID